MACFWASVIFWRVPPWIRASLCHVLYKLTTKWLFILPRAFCSLSLCSFPVLLVLCTSIFSTQRREFLESCSRMDYLKQRAWLLQRVHFFFFKQIEKGEGKFSLQNTSILTQQIFCFQKVNRCEILPVTFLVPSNIKINQFFHS